MPAAAKRPVPPVQPNVRSILAVNLIALRTAREWSQDALALEAGLHRTFVAHVERQARNISIDNVEKLANALGVPVGDLFADRTTRSSRR